jgi:hypothetical protein
MNLHLTLMIILIITANIVGYIILQKKNNLYFAAFTVLVLAVPFGGLGGILAELLIGSSIAGLYGVTLASFLLINSVILFLFALTFTVIRAFDET